MLLTFLAGLVTGGAIGWFFYFQSRRETLRQEETTQTLSQEKQIVLEFMHNLVESVGEGINRQELFQRVVHTAVISTGALSAAIFEKVDHTLKPAAIEGLFPPQRPFGPPQTSHSATRASFIEDTLRSQTLEIGEGVLGLVARCGQGVLITDAHNDPRIIDHQDPALTIRSLICVPILFRNNVLGVLAIANPAEGSAFTETDFSLARSIGEQAGLAIHNLDMLAFRIEKNKLDVDLALARNIQSMLLPSQYPHIPGLEIDTRYMPAHSVGGDLYDVFELPHGKLGVAIADVSGKGIPASLIMAICQSNLRHFARQHESPSRVLQELNQVLNHETRDDMFITLVYAIIDVAAGTICLARAGHELPLHYHPANGASEALTESIQSPGMAVGMVPSEIFNNVLADHLVEFRPGEIFHLYTDGITEAINAQGDEFSTTRLSEAIARYHKDTPHRINQAILDQVKDFSGSPEQADDITLVTIRRN